MATETVEQPVEVAVPNTYQLRRLGFRGFLANFLKNLDFSSIFVTFSLENWLLFPRAQAQSKIQTGSHSPDHRGNSQRILIRTQLHVIVESKRRQRQPDLRHYFRQN